MWQSLFFFFCWEFQPQKKKKNGDKVQFTYSKLNGYYSNFLRTLVDPNLYRGFGINFLLAPLKKIDIQTSHLR